MPVDMDDRLSMVMGAALKAQVQQAALQQGARDGRPISISEWIREAIRQRLEREAIDGGIFSRR